MAYRNMENERLSKTAWGILIVLFIAIQVIALNPAWVEKYYTYCLYPLIAGTLRFLFGWLPFSLGDILYLAAACFIVYNLVRLMRALVKKTMRRKTVWPGVKKSAFLMLTVSVAFYGLWGMNYSRAGIAEQLKLTEQKYTVRDLDTLVGILHDRLNENAALLTPAMRDSVKSNRDLFSNALLLYHLAEKKYPFLYYRSVSVKSSLFSYLGNYLGFQGYYNPFTGEAQLNTTIPACEEPFVMAHEIAHQLGYAKESEANFVGFLACRLHPSVNFKYSVYFDMYHYAIKELAGIDAARAGSYDSSLHKQVKNDRMVLRTFYRQYRNPVEPLISDFYGYFLKANNQPRGKASYNEVIVWLIAYYKRYGAGAV
ncbi:MAG: DUF3810 domain-containing protein [Niabella sp.]